MQSTCKVDFDQFMATIIELPTAARTSAAIKHRSNDTANPSVTVFAEGSRNNSLFSLAGSMRRRGMGLEAIEAALLATNASQADPPLPESEVMQIANSIMRYAPGSDASIMESLNDVGNAVRFVNSHQDYFRYILERQLYMIWQDDRWIIDIYGVHAMALAKMTAVAIFQEAMSQTNLDVMRAVSRHANNSHNSARIKAMLEIAALDPLLCVPAIKLDADPMKLGVENGVIDLRTGQLEVNRPGMLITRYSEISFDKKAKCPIFIAFLKKIFNRDKNKIAFIRRVVGYCLTGQTNEQVYFFFFGFGANGKTTLLRVLELLLGSDMSKQTPAETLMAKTQGNKQSNDLARLAGVRVVIANEVEDGSLLAESLVKQITGGDTVTARYLFKEYFEFTPEFKLIIAGNHKPIIKSNDDGIWRRTVFVDFPVSIPKSEQDPDLINKLEAELPGILNWAMAGCLKWQKTGLAIPKSVAKDVNDYKEEMDWLGQWMADCCEVGKGYSERASALYFSYGQWAINNGIPVSSSTTFGRKLAERGMSKSRRSNGQWYKGVSVKKGM